jgi:citronellol/citronellal dehydrogenase
LAGSGDPEEIAWMVAYLASPAGGFASGAVITIDGARDNWFGPGPQPAIAGEGGEPVAEERRRRP